MIKKYSILKAGYTLSEIVIVMLIISVVVAVTIGITKRKLESTVSYTYYSAYETLKDVSRSLLTDFNPKNEKYQAMNVMDRLAKASGHNTYTALLDSLWEQPAYAKCVVTCTDHGLKCQEVCDETPGYGLADDQYYVPGNNVYEGDASLSTGYEGACTEAQKQSALRKCQSKCGNQYIMSADGCSCTCLLDHDPIDPCPDSDSDRQACIAKGGFFNNLGCKCEMPEDPVCNKTCTAGYHLDETACECVLDTPTPEPDGDDPVAVCAPGDTPPECGQQCVDGQWQAIPGFSKDCAEYTEEWHDLPECKCMPVARTLPRTGENFCALFEERVNTNAGDCTGSTISSTTTNFSDKTPDLVLRNGIRIYNLHSDPVRLDELAGNKTGFTISYGTNASASAVTTTRIASSNTQYLAMQNEALNMFIRKPLSFFPLLSGLFEQRSYAINPFEEVVTDMNCDICNIPNNPYCPKECSQVKLPDSNLSTGYEGACTEAQKQSALRKCQSKCGNQYIMSADGCSCTCLLDHDPIDPCPDSDSDRQACIAKGGFFNNLGCKCEMPEDPVCNKTCTAGYHLDEATCSCVKDEPAGDDGEDPDNGGGETPPVTPDPDDNLPKVDTGEYGYIVYVDIDGAKGSSTLWEDVYPFYITLSGQVVPAFHSSDGDNFGGNSDEYLQTSIQYEKINANGRRSITWLDKSVSFKEGACGSGYINSSTPYCSGVSEHAECSSNVSGSKCTLKTVKPVKFF